MAELRQPYSTSVYAEKTEEPDLPGGKYLYCIIRCGEERVFADAVPIGRWGGQVYTVPVNGLALVISNSPEREYESTRVNLLDHARVLEQVMEEFTILPVRFGTVSRPTLGAADESLSSLQGVQKVLRKRRQEFDQLLAEMEGKVELGLKALWRDDKAIFEEILAENPTLLKRRNALARKPAAAVRVEGLHLGEMVKEALDQKRAAEATRLLAPLRQIASRTIEHQVVVDRMIASAAFLVDRGRQEEFDQAVNRLDGELGERVTLKYVGPVPPYNFVNITVNWEDL